MVSASNCNSSFAPRQHLEFRTSPTITASESSVYTDNRQNQYAFIDWNAITKDAEHATVPGHVPLLTHSKTRSLLASIGNEPVASQFIELKIPPAPGREDEAWSDWIFATQRADLSLVPEAERMALRCRVRPAND